MNDNVYAIYEDERIIAVEKMINRELNMQGIKPMCRYNHFDYKDIKAVYEKLLDYFDDDFKYEGIDYNGYKLFIGSKVYKEWNNAKFMMRISDTYTSDNTLCAKIQFGLMFFNKDGYGTHISSLSFRVSGIFTISVGILTEQPLLKFLWMFMPNISDKMLQMIMSNEPNEPKILE